MRVRRTTIHLAVVAISLIGVWLVGCGSTSAHGPPAPTGTESVALDEAAPMAAPEQSRTESSATGRHAYAAAQSTSPSSPEAEPPEVADDEPRDGRQMIYTGSVILAIYDVGATQEEAVELIESIDGYVSERTSRSLTARVPAEAFRDAFDAIEQLGDVLDTSWRARDVTDEVRDHDIRLRNARSLRDRLEELLDDAETVEDTLKIEKELERITLEIERIKGTLQSLEDRIAYSTIEITFERVDVDDVPDDEFLLPFRWLDTLGLQSLIRSPGVYR